MMPETTAGGEALAGAIEYVEAGYLVGPVTIRLRRDGKKDATFHTNWVNDPNGITGDVEAVLAWAKAYPGCSWHAPCGPNGMVVAEGDVKGAESGVWNWRKAGGPTTPMKVTTRSGGEHWYFRAPADDDPAGPIRNSAGTVPGVHAVDVRGEGGTVFIAGSVVHGGGGHYSTSRVVPRDQLPELPGHWARRLREAGAHSRRATEVDEDVPQTHERGWLARRAEEAFADIEGGEEAGFRERLFTAAVFGFRAVDAGLMEREEVLARCYEAIRATWGHEPNEDDREWLRDAWHKAQRNPWTIVDDGEAPPPELDTPSDGGSDEGAAQEAPRVLTPAEREELAVVSALRELRIKAEARQRLAAENTPPLTILGIDEFLARPRPEPLVDGLLYRNSLSRLFGAPGCGKSYVALDVALRVALGWEWGGRPAKQSKVIYIMAEGDAVNIERSRAWMDRHRVGIEELRGWFEVVPHKVLLTEEALRPFVEQAVAREAELVILDTKNRMMLGNENTSEDNATMVRALDSIREATGCCALLIDHTGLNATGRAKGDNATEGSMETEAEVTNDHQHPPKITVTITRDKAREDGTAWEFFLRSHPLEDGTPAAVLLPVGDDVDLPAPRPLPGEVARAWMHTERALPDAVTDYEGPGKAAVPDLARFMAHDAGAADPDGIGVTRAQAQTALSVRALGGVRGHSEAAVRRAWSALRAMGYIAPADGKDGSDGGAENRTGHHVWTARAGS